MCIANDVGGQMQAAVCLHDVVHQRLHVSFVRCVRILKLGVIALGSDGGCHGFTALPINIGQNDPRALAREGFSRCGTDTGRGCRH
jgi:hypothetical protein